MQVKDLKKQLQAEKRRSDRLQERLQELLSDSKDRQCKYGVSFSVCRRRGGMTVVAETIPRIQLVIVLFVVCSYG